MVTGSVAGVYHGFPRVTHDIDLVIAPDAEGLRRLIERFSEDRFYLSREAAEDALRHRSMFNIIALESGWKFDLIVRKDRPFSRAEFARREARKQGGQTIWVATVEDLLIAKMEWAKAGQSGRQLEDAASILRIQAGRVDLDYVERWVGELGLGEEWAAVTDPS